MKKLLAMIALTLTFAAVAGSAAPRDMPIAELLSLRQLDLYKDLEGTRSGGQT